MRNVKSPLIQEPTEKRLSSRLQVLYHEPNSLLLEVTRSDGDDEPMKEEVVLQETFCQRKVVE